MALTAANKITIARILAVPFFVTAVLSYSPQADYLRYVALGIYLFAAISDVVDGYIARTRGQATAVGAILDSLNCAQLTGLIRSDIFPRHSCHMCHLSLRIKPGSDLLHLPPGAGQNPRNQTHPETLLEA